MKSYIFIQVSNLQHKTINVMLVVLVKCVKELENRVEVFVGSILIVKVDFYKNFYYNIISIKIK